MYLKRVLFISLLTVFSNVTSDDIITDIYSDLIEDRFDKVKSEKLLLKLQDKANLTVDNDLRLSIFIASAEIMEVHSSLDELNLFFDENINKYEEDYNAFLRLYSHNIILKKLLNNSKEYAGLLARLESNQTDDYRAYYFAINLYLEPTEKNYSRLNTHCENKCNFGLMHMAIMHYHNTENNLHLLEKYSFSLVERYITNGHWMNDYFTERLAFAYLSKSIRTNKKNDSGMFKQLAFDGVSKDSLLYLLLDNAII